MKIKFKNGTTINFKPSSKPTPPSKYHATTMLAKMPKSKKTNS